MSCEFSANKVTKLEERPLTHPVYSLRKTHAYDELPFAEQNRAVQALQTVIWVWRFRAYFTEETIPFQETNHVTLYENNQ
jgi:hypothetical protein